MNRIFKVVGNFPDDKFDKMLATLEKHFSFMYLDETLFLSLNDYRDEDNVGDILKSVFKPAKDYYIQTITYDSVHALSPIVKEWCLNNFAKLNMQSVEDEEQDKLQMRMQALKLTEERLKELSNKHRKEGS